MAKKRTAGGKEPVTLINFLLDRSGSMNEVLDGTISGFNEFLSSQKAEAGTTLFSLTTFCTDAANRPLVQSVHVARPVAEVPELDRDTYRPNGMTPLYDALAETLERVEDRIAATLTGKPDVVLFVVMTDGRENASREFSSASIRPLVERAERELGWTFVFLGANQDVWAAGGQMGIARGNARDYSDSYAKGDMGTVFRELGDRTSRLRAVACSASVTGDDAAYQAVRKDFWAEG